MKYGQKVRTFAASALGAWLVSCSGSEGGSSPTPPQPFEIQFDARLGGQRPRCGADLPGVGSNARAVSLKDLRFFVHDVQLITSGGKRVPLEVPDDGIWQYRGVSLIDFEDKTGDCSNGTAVTNAIIRGNAPSGSYTGIAFRIGVPPDISHGDTGAYRAPLTATPLYWGWLQGFIFHRLDLAMSAAAGEAAGAFEVHLGADQCSRKDGGFTCGRENIAQVELSGFDPAKSKVVLDLSSLLGDVNIAARTGEQGVPGCVSGADDPDCGPVFAGFGLDLASGEPKAAATAFLVQEQAADDPGRTGEAPPDAGTSTLADAGSDAGASDYALKLPVGFSPPNIPADNPLTEAKVELGRHLFYDRRLSGNQTQSCASCHKQELAFTDGRPVGLGSTGEMHIRGSMSLANVAYTTTLTWANPTLIKLEDQAHVPMFGEKPVELGLAGMEDELISRLRAVDKYQTLFPAAFPEQEPFTVANIKKAIASFERTLISGNSPYDRYLAGDSNALSASAKHGMDLFFDPNPSGTAVECFHCHGGPTLSDQLSHANQPSGVEPFHNTGLYNLDFEGSYPMGNQGVYESSGIRNDKGRFKAPTLRNIAVTAPYMHDGSIATLEDVVAHYAAGGRLIESGPNAGDGRVNRNKSEFVHGFSKLTAQDKADIVEFLKTLTDDEFLTNPKYKDPWLQ